MPPQDYPAPSLKYWRMCGACLSHKELAALSGIGVSRIRRIEAGGTAAPEVLQQLSRALEADLAQYEHEDGPPKIDVTRPLDVRQQGMLDRAVG